MTVKPNLLLLAVRCHMFHNFFDMKAQLIRTGHRQPIQHRYHKGQSNHCHQMVLVQMWLLSCEWWWSWWYLFRMDSHPHLHDLYGISALQAFL